MSTPRRALGTGPATSTRTTPTSPSPRRLAAERIGDEHQAVEDEHQEVSRPTGRRPLGERGQ
ncbi:hypothetical protein ACFYZ8_44675 [Streptomyces sp. NPDC001668]|uniref:hypothetical protein n=1 Tax=unclassified Streptomyces TaxID=2593676 RepID=UPI0033AEB985